MIKYGCAKLNKIEVNKLIDGVVHLKSDNFQDHNQFKRLV